MNKKYIVHVAGSTYVGLLIIYALNCHPLPPTVISQIARNVVDPACMVKSYDIEPLGFPGRINLQPIGNNSAIFGTPASNISLSAVTASGTFF